MFREVSIFLVFVSSVRCQFCDDDENPKFEVFPAVPLGLENHDLFVKIKNPTPIENCEIVIHCGEDEHNFTINSGYINESGWFYWGNEKNGECGIFITSDVEQPTGNYLFRVTDDGGETTAKKVNVVFEKPAMTQQKEEVSKEVGSSFTIKCYVREDPNDDTKDPKIMFSKIFTPGNEMVYEGTFTSWDIENVRKKDEGTWKCVSILDIGEHVLTRETQLTVIEANLKSQKIETDTHVNLLWTIPKNWKDYVIDDCFFEAPNGEMIFPLEGVVYERYAYYGKGKDHNECGISIPKPLSENENGIWKVVIPARAENTHKQHAGGFIDVRRSAKSKELPLGETDLVPGTKHKKIEITAGMDLTVECNVRESLTYCYLESPSGNLYNGWDHYNETSFYTGSGMGIGDCQITIPGKLVNASHSGQWTCSMGVENVYSDLQVPIDVVIRSNNFAAARTEVKAEVGSSAILACQSVTGYALNYCRFNSPDNVGINLLKNNVTINSKYSYSGQGLEAGECGIKIEPISTEDFGIWKCSASIAGVLEKTEYIDQITLTEEEGWSSEGVAIGLGVAVGVVALTLAGLTIWKRTQSRRRRNQRRTQQEENEEVRPIPEDVINRIPRDRSSTHSSTEISHVDENNERVYYNRDLSEI